MWCGVTCQVSHDTNTDDWGDPCEEMSCGNMNIGHLSSFVSSFTLILLLFLLCHITLVTNQSIFQKVS